MTGFTSLLSSIGRQQKASQPQQGAPKPLSRPQISNKVETSLTPSNAAAGVKRKLAEVSDNTGVSVTNALPRKPTLHTTGSSSGGASSIKLSSSSSTASAPYRGTARSAITTSSTRPAVKQNPTSNMTSGASITSDTSAPKTAQKRGFASIMEKAKAAQEAAKASGSSGIKHKPVERLTKRERQRQREEMQQKSQKSGKITAQSRGKGVPPIDPKVAVKQKAPETAYKGTMKPAPVQATYKGTMRALGSGTDGPKAATKKGQGQDKYGGYASWSDLDDAEDEEEDYDSGGSSDMEAGWGDTEREEVNALRYAKQEDQEALEEEERLKREKLERKRRLLELSKSNAGKRKY